MFAIRKGVFETNSSSVHSIVFMNSEEFEKYNSENYCLLTADSMGFHKGDIVPLYEVIIAARRQIEKDMIDKKEWTFLGLDLHSTDDEIQDRLQDWSYIQVAHSFYPYPQDVNYTDRFGERIYTVCAYGYD